ERCRICHLAKTHGSNAGLYTPLSVPNAPWKDTFDASQVSKLYFSEIVKLHGVPKTLTSDHDVNISGDSPKKWDLTLSQAEFIFNKSVNRTTSKSPSEVVYGRNPITPLELAPIIVTEPTNEDADQHATDIKQLHQQVREQILHHNKQYAARSNKHRKRVIYQEGDLVWIRLRKERFPSIRFGKLKPRVDVPFHVLTKVNEEGENDAGKDTNDINLTLSDYFQEVDLGGGI
ncbi:RNA-directed DNA polymerase, partial [Tanacetum coccineum]